MARITTPPDPNAAVTKTKQATDDAAADAFIRAGAEKELGVQEEEQPKKKRVRMAKRERDRYTFRLLTNIVEDVYAEAERLELKPSQIIEWALRSALYGDTPPFELPIQKGEDKYKI